MRTFVRILAFLVVATASSMAATAADLGRDYGDRGAYVVRPAPPPPRVVYYGGPAYWGPPAVYWRPRVYWGGPVYWRGPGWGWRRPWRPGWGIGWRGPRYWGPGWGVRAGWGGPRYWGPRRRW